jgi:hypothetical protein
MRKTAASKEKDALERLHSQIQAEQKLKAGPHFLISSISRMISRVTPQSPHSFLLRVFIRLLQVLPSINSDSSRTSFWPKSG